MFCTVHHWNRRASANALFYCRLFATAGGGLGMVRGVVLPIRQGRHGE